MAASALPATVDHSRRSVRGRRGEGRPSIYTPELATKICERIAAGESITSIATRDDMPDVSTITLWAADNDEFSPLYARACRAAAEVIAHQSIGLPDAMDAQAGPIDKERVRLMDIRVRGRQWLAERWSQRYASKSQVDVRVAQYVVVAPAEVETAEEWRERHAGEIHE